MDEILSIDLGRNEARQEEGKRRQTLKYGYAAQ
jgi:hypothetical protein